VDINLKFPATYYLTLYPHT